MKGQQKTFGACCTWCMLNSVYSALSVNSSWWHGEMERDDLTLCSWDDGRVVEEKEGDGGWRWEWYREYRRIWEIRSTTCLIGCYASGVTVIFPWSHKIAQWSLYRYLIRNHELLLEFLYWIYLLDLFTYWSYLHCWTFISTDLQQQSNQEQIRCASSLDQDWSQLLHSQWLLLIGRKAYSWSPTKQLFTYAPMVPF